MSKLIRVCAQCGRKTDCVDTVTGMHRLCHRHCEDKQECDNTKHERTIPNNTCVICNEDKLPGGYTIVRR